MDSALRYINQTLLNTNTIDLQDILEMHHRVLGNVAPTDAGRLRNTQVKIAKKMNKNFQASLNLLIFDNT